MTKLDSELNEKLRQGRVRVTEVRMVVVTEIIKHSRGSNGRCTSPHSSPNKREGENGIR